MALPSVHTLSVLGDIPQLCAAIAASPALRDLLETSRSPQAGVGPIPASATRGDVIVAVYDLLMDTPLAPYAAEIVDAVLSQARAVGGRSPTAH